MEVNRAGGACAVHSKPIVEGGGMVSFARFRSWAPLLGILMALACRNKVSEVEVCVPGETQTCTCDGTDVGVQVCVESGSTWGQCNCTATGDTGDSDTGDSDTSDDTSGDTSDDTEPVELDQYGGNMAVIGTETGVWHIELIGDRWWLVTPEGHGAFIRAVSMVDTSIYGGAGGFLSYDAVHLESGGTLSANLSEEAASTVAGDVISESTAATLTEVGDAIVLGWRAPPYVTYFWLEQVGEGGAVSWYYSTKDGWALVGGDGLPYAGEVLNDDGSYNLDMGGFMAPDEDGFGDWENVGANRIYWWSDSLGVPDDFAPTALSEDDTPLYYIKGVVNEAFTTPPVLNQLYERPYLLDAIEKKYGPEDPLLNWASATVERLRAWGFSAAGQYSYRYDDYRGELAAPLPIEETWQLSGWALGSDYGYKIKNVIAGAECPPGSGDLVWQGQQADVFEPAYATALAELASENSADIDEWVFALIPEEADHLFGLNAASHEHMGYTVLSQNPYMVEDSSFGVTYTDPMLYAKYALRDFLRYRYRQDTSLAAFDETSDVPLYSYSDSPKGEELAALEALNTAWATSYSSWGTSSGELTDGSNGYGTGTGFMDENGQGVLVDDSCAISYQDVFTDPKYPAIQEDLDDFVSLAAGRYGWLLSSALEVVEPPVLLPLYESPDFVYEALGPYVDGFWVAPDTSAHAYWDTLYKGKTFDVTAKLQSIYDAGGKPVLLAEYFTANPDSALQMAGEVTAISYDDSSGQTEIVADGLEYRYRTSWFVGFPDVLVSEFEGGGCGWLVDYPRVQAHAWSSVSVDYDYTGCVEPGMTVERANWWGLDPIRSQQERAEIIIDVYDAALNLTGADGIAFVIGFEHWALYDQEVSAWTEVDNFGLLTVQDNAYDGVEAVHATATDAAGRIIGAEEADYGDLLGPLSDYLGEIYDRIDDL